MKVKIQNDDGDWVEKELTSIDIGDYDKHQHKIDGDSYKTYQIKDIETDEYDPNWMPNYGDSYWYISKKSSIFCTPWTDCDSDKEKLEIGNVYKTEKQANQVVKKQKARMRIIRSVAKKNDGWEVIWNTQNRLPTGGHYVYYYHEGGHFMHTLDATCQFAENCFYLKSKELAQEMIEEHAGDYRIMWGIDW